MKHLSILIVTTLILSSCGNTMKKSQALKEIDEKHQAFYDGLQSTDFDFEEARTLADLYIDYIESYPKDTNIPKVKIELAGLYVNFLGEIDKGLSEYLSVKEDFPESRFAPVGIFALATIYHDRLKDYDAATKYYEMVRDEYPEHHLAAEAAELLKHIGLTDEELLEAILKKNADSLEVSEVDSTI